MPKRFVFIYGPVACGKFTTAKELAKITDFKLFHNHLVIDAVLSLFDYGTANFVKHREKIWYEMVADAIDEGKDIIFTFNPEFTVNSSFVDTITRIVEERDGTILFVEVTCTEEEICKRIESESRKAYHKLSSAAFYLELKGQNAFAFPHIPSTITIDSTSQSAVDSAMYIANALSLLPPETSSQTNTEAVVQV